MKKLTKKYIFECRLKGVPVQVDAGALYHKGILNLLVTTGIWKKDAAGTNKYWNEYSFTALYPIQFRDENIDGSYNWQLITKGCHHLVCL